MAAVLFTNYSSQSWNLKRYQPVLYLSNERETPFAIPRVDGQTITCDPEGRDSVHLHARWRVPSFGEVILMTGCLKPREASYNLNLELARERLTVIAQKLGDWQARGFVPSQAFTQEYERATYIFSAINNQEDETVNARWADLSLSLSMPAGEKLALEFADWGIEQRKQQNGFTDFLLGCNFYHFPVDDTAYATHYERLFNFGTLPFYWSYFEPQPGRHNWKDTDLKLAWLKKRKMKVKGHPLYWAHTVPGWVNARDLTKLQECIRERIATVVGHYKGVIDYWDVINEIQHFLKARVTRYTPDEAIELTRLCSECTRLADPQAKRIVNADDPFGEYMAWKPESGFAPLDYFEELERRKVDYDAIGIQLYYGGGFSYCRDLLEISRYFDCYEKFNKELHLTETSAPSQEGEDPMDLSHPQSASQVVEEVDLDDVDREEEGGVPQHEEPWEESTAFWKASGAGFWHEPWSQKNQADWVEGFFKVLMGKPFVKAITWWDFSDAYRHFWNYSGLLDGEMKPKESYYRLLALKNYTIGV
jgi:endo-1,4-beta-xylanase